MGIISIVHSQVRTLKGGTILGLLPWHLPSLSISFSVPWITVSCYKYDSHWNVSSLRTSPLGPAQRSLLAQGVLNKSV